MGVSDPTDKVSANLQPTGSLHREAKHNPIRAICFGQLPVLGHLASPLQHKPLRPR